MTPVDGDDMTTDWWRLPASAGQFDSDMLSGSHVTQTLYGTLHNGEVAGLSLVDVPQTYNTKTSAENTRAALWHLGVTVVKLSERINLIEHQVNTPVEKAPDAEQSVRTDIASLFEAVRGIQFALQDLQQRLDDMTADS